MSKNKKNSNYQTGAQKSLTPQNTNNKRFEPRDLLCVLAALLFIGSWLYNKQVAAIPLKTLRIIYIAILVLLGVYFFISPKFQATWRRWDKHTKLFLLILILGDLIALITYNIMQSILYIIIFVVANFLYYVLFLRNKTQNDTEEPQNKKL